MPAKKSHNLPLDHDGTFLIPREVACQILGVDTSTFARWIKTKGITPPNMSSDMKMVRAMNFAKWIREEMTQIRGPGRYENYPYMPEGWFRYVEEKNDGPVTMDTEKLRKMSAEADKVERENAVSEGRLVPVEDVEQAWSDILARVRSRMMRVPSASARMVVGEDDMAKVTETIESFVRDALSEMSADWREKRDDPNELG